MNHSDVFIGKLRDFFEKNGVINVKINDSWQCEDGCCQDFPEIVFYFNDKNTTSLTEDDFGKCF